MEGKRRGAWALVLAVATVAGLAAPSGAGGSDSVGDGAGRVLLVQSDDCRAAANRPRTPSAAARALRCVVARLRALHDLPPLDRSARLAASAQRHARDMVRRRYFSHTTPGGSELADRLRGYAEPAPWWWIGEVLAWGAGERSRPIDVVRRWLASPSHRRVLLTPDAREIGIGVAMGAPVATAWDDSATFVVQLGWRR
jgi:uncharacterized protein YkwD